MKQGFFRTYKRAAALAVLLALVLTGCGQGTPAQTTPAATEPAMPTAALYEPDSTVEIATGGAVRAYPIPGGEAYAMTAMGSRLVLLYRDGTVLALQGDDCQPVATLVTGADETAVPLEFDADSQGAAYYLPDCRQVVLVNPQLQETGRVTLPEEFQGTPVVSLKNQQVYYCLPGQVRAMGLQSGISRLLRSYSQDTDYRVQDCLFDGTVLLLEQDGGQSLCVSAQNGQLLDTVAGLTGFTTWGKHYCGQLENGSLTQYTWGSREGDPQCLEAGGTLWPALALGGVVASRYDGQDLQLDFYQMDSGQRTAAVTLPGVGEPVAVTATETHLWLLAEGSSGQTLYRWDMSGSPTGDETVHSSPLYTVESPDTEGLAALQERVDAMNKQYGLRIAIWQDAVQTDGGYDLEPEHHVSRIRQTLDILEPVLAQFPARFLQKTVEAGWIRLCLVSEVGTDSSWVQYWADGDCYVAITCTDGAVADFIRGAAYGVDSHVLGNSRDFDHWDQLNPEGFAYDYALTQPRTDGAQYLEGETQAFVDAASMATPQEDRARLFAAAMEAGNGQLFAAPLLQAKLQYLCQAIREAYSLEKYTDPLPWEQYLQPAGEEA